MEKSGDDNSDNEFRKNLSGYRQSLGASYQVMQGEYDKGVLTLSGGALGVSFAFLKDIVGTKNLTHPGLLLSAWSLWALSLAFVLISYFCSAKAMLVAMAQTDELTIYMKLAKSGWATATKVLNGLSGSSFVLGLVLIILFVGCNFPH